MASHQGFRVGKVVLLAVAVVAAVVGKWQLPDEGEVWDWLFNLLIGCLVVAEALEIMERVTRRRRGARDEEANAVEPGGGAPGWRWDPARSTWNPPEF